MWRKCYTEKYRFECGKECCINCLFTIQDCVKSCLTLLMVKLHQLVEQVGPLPPTPATMATSWWEFRPGPVWTQECGVEWHLLAHVKKFTYDSYNCMSVVSMWRKCYTEKYRFECGKECCINCLFTIQDCVKSCLTLLMVKLHQLVEQVGPLPPTPATMATSWWDVRPGPVRKLECGVEWHLLACVRNSYKLALYYACGVCWENVTSG